MVDNPEDLIGKWFSNVSGKPEHYFYILDASYTTPKERRKHFRANVSTDFIQVKNRSIDVGRSAYNSLSTFGDPLTKEKHPELTYQIHKCIRYLFEKRDEIHWSKL